MGTLNIHMRQVEASPLINFPRPPAFLPAAPSAHEQEPSFLPAGPSPHEQEPSQSSRSTTPRMFDQCHVEKIISGPSTPVPEKCNVEDGQVNSMTSGSCRSTLYSEFTPATSVAEFDHPTEGQIAFFSDAGLTSVTTPDCRDSNVLSEERLKATSGTMGLNLYRRRVQPLYLHHQSHNLYILISFHAVGKVFQELWLLHTMTNHIRWYSSIQA